METVHSSGQEAHLLSDWLAGLAAADPQLPDWDTSSRGTVAGSVDMGTHRTDTVAALPPPLSRLRQHPGHFKVRSSFI